MDKWGEEPCMKYWSVAPQILFLPMHIESQHGYGLFIATWQLEGMVFSKFLSMGESLFLTIEIWQKGSKNEFANKEII